VEHKSFPAGMKINRRSTADELAEMLRQLILNGEMAPGVPLRESALAQAVGVSRNTLRESCFTLVAEGLIRHVPHHGFFVVKLTPEDVADIYKARRLLELAALEVLSPDDGVERLEAALGHLRRAAADNDPADVYEGDLEIHRALVSALGSARLDNFVAGLQAELRLATILLDRQADFDELVTEHERFVAMVQAGDKDGARAFLREHLDTAEQQLVATVSAQP
jgi:DNA-binding GntR family transcriptional regulator